VADAAVANVDVAEPSASVVLPLTMTSWPTRSGEDGTTAAALQFSFGSAPLPLSPISMFPPILLSTTIRLWRTVVSQIVGPENVTVESLIERSWPFVTGAAGASPNWEVPSSMFPAAFALRS
jgi:hypothetical protein